jgi:hypothetical protein
LLIGDFQGAGRRLKVKLAVKLLKLFLQAGSVSARFGRRKRIFSRTVRLGNNIGSCGTRYTPC